MERTIGFCMGLVQAMSTTQEWVKEGMTEEEKKRLEEVENNPQLKMGLKFMRSGVQVSISLNMNPGIQQ